MKLNVVVEDVVEREIEGTKIRGMRMPLGGLPAGIFGLAAALSLTWAGPVRALDGIDLSKPAEAPAPGECPRLIQIKYPFLSCENGVIGLADGDSTWENTRQIPTQSDFIEGNGYWGDELNRD